MKEAFLPQNLFKRKIKRFKQLFSIQLIWTIICILFIGGSVLIYKNAYDIIQEEIAKNQEGVIIPDSIYFGRQKYKVLNYEDGLYQIKSNVWVSKKNINLKPKQND